MRRGASPYIKNNPLIPNQLNCRMINCHNKRFFFVFLYMYRLLTKHSKLETNALGVRGMGYGLYCGGFLYAGGGCDLYQIYLLCVFLSMYAKTYWYKSIYIYVISRDVRERLLCMWCFCILFYSFVNLFPPEYSLNRWCSAPPNSPAPALRV